MHFKSNSNAAFVNNKFCSKQLPKLKKVLGVVHLSEVMNPLSTFIFLVAAWVVV